jgi:hypothetical protein
MQHLIKKQPTFIYATDKQLDKKSHKKTNDNDSSYRINRICFAFTLDDKLFYRNTISRKVSYALYFANRSWLDYLESLQKLLCAKQVKPKFDTI